MIYLPEWFQTNRTELWNYIERDVFPYDKKFKLVHAPVKSGKRGMVEVYSLLDKSSKHIFLTALHRKADKKQREELSSYGIEVFSVNNKSKKDKCIKYVDELVPKNRIKIHLDELDFGCGDKQLLNKIWLEYRNNPNVDFILYSATIEVAKTEFLDVNNITDFYECKRFEPPETYFGIKKYLETNQFFQATPFVHYNEQFEIAEQGKNLIKKLVDCTRDNTRRHIGILRLAGNFKISNKQVSQFEMMKENKETIEEKYKITLKFVGSNDNMVEWDNQKYWEEFESTKPFIFVINQVSGRSTEWKCHPYIVWYHTLRTDETPIGTIIQDQERSVLYTTTYTDYNINIEVYGDILCANYSAGNITLQDVLSKTSRKLNVRLDTKTKKKNIEVYENYYNTWEEIPPEYKKGKSKKTHVNKENVLNSKMTVKEKEYEIKNWNKYSHLEGFYMTNIRSSRNNFILGKPKQKPIWFKSDIKSELKEGINEHSRVRINLFYEDNETDPSNFKFIVRRFKQSKESNCSNTTMYNN